MMWLNMEFVLGGLQKWSRIRLLKILIQIVIMNNNQDFKLNFNKKGTSTEFIILLHGIGGSMMSFNGIIDILKEHGFIEKRLKYDPEIESRDMKQCLTDARLSLDEGDWKEARSLLNQAQVHVERSEQTAWFITDAGRDFLKNR